MSGSIRFVARLDREPVRPTSFGDCGREILSIAHELRTTRPLPAMFVRQVRDQFFIHFLNEQNEGARMCVSWDSRWGWLFTEMRAL